jgi:vacuolar-type H+-ATPase subunit I/STV1
MKPLSADCQEVLIERDILVKVISQLDSFEVLKQLEKEYIAFQDSCFMFITKQKEIINTQDALINNCEGRVKNLQEVNEEHKQLIEINETLVQDLIKKNRVAKRNTIISLVSGGILTIGLTTSLLIVLL